MIEESGIGLQNLIWFIGAVENNLDERMEGRVQVRAFGVHGTVSEVATQDLPWATLITGTYGSTFGVPALNSWVFGFFVDGRDAQQPMILGVIPTQMTEQINPELNGWGVIPSRDFNLLGQGSRPQDYGQPHNSRLSRGENLHETYLTQQETFRVQNVSGAGGQIDAWNEPAPAYNSEYPFNRVTETPGGHVVELDDTPGAERIMVWHRSGSYVQIDSRGTSTYKSVSDRYDINDNNYHVYVGGRSNVTVMGDSYINVMGNKIEEVSGNYEQIVRGNYVLSVAGQLNLNGSDDVQIRASKLRFESNVENFSIKSAKNISIQSGEKLDIKSGLSIHVESAENIHIKSGVSTFMLAETDINLKSNAKTLITSLDSINIKSETNVFLDSSNNTHIKSGASIFNQSSNSFAIKSGSTINIDASSTTNIKGSSISVDSDSKLSLIGSSIKTSTNIDLGGTSAATSAASATASSLAASAESASSAIGVDMPEPAEKSVSVVSSSSEGGGGSASSSSAGYRNSSSIGSSGAISQDDEFNDQQNTDGGSVTTGRMKPLLDLIGFAEGASYDTIYGGIRREDYPPTNLTNMTIQKVLSWQDSIDSKYISEASGRYQIIEDTLRTLVSAGAAQLSDKFDANTQDILAIYLAKIRGLNRFINGTLSREEFGNNLASEWASFPVITGPGAGRSKYQGDAAGNQSRVSIQTVLDVLDKVKNYQEPTTSQSTSGGPF